MTKYNLLYIGMVFTARLSFVPVALAGEQVPETRDLAQVAEGYGFPAPEVQGDRVVVGNRYAEMVFAPGSRKVYFNHLLVWLHYPVLESGKGWSIAGRDVSCVIDPLLRTAPVLAEAGRSVVVLDPGHGGEDGGARGPRGVLEKNIVLKIARRVQTRLKASRIAVHSTRKSDRFVPLAERASIADRLEADVFVSIHLNSSSRQGATGFETYVLSSSGCPSTGGTLRRGTEPGHDYERASTILAYCVHRGLASYAGGTDRGIKRARFQVLRETACPAALVECGFLSNPEAELLLSTEAHRERVAAGIASGIFTYLGRVLSANAALDRKQ